MENQLLDNNLKINQRLKDFEDLNLRPNEQRAKFALALIWIVLSVEVIALVSSGLQYDLLQTVANGGEITEEVATANDLREQIIGIIYLIVYIVSGISFIMWFRRAYFNLHQINRNLSFTEGWAAGSWFVPFVNLYRPYQIMRELYEETKNFIIKNDELSQVKLTSNILGVWWTLWIINGIFGQIIFRFARHADTLPELITLTTLSLISGVIGVGLAFVTIKIIKDYSNIEGLIFNE